MSYVPLYFIIISLIILIPVVDAQVESTITFDDTGYFIVEYDSIEITDGEKFDLYYNVIDVETPFNATIGDVTIQLSKQIQILSITDEKQITIKNSGLGDEVVIEIADETIIYGTENWDSTLSLSRFEYLYLFLSKSLGHE